MDANGKDLIVISSTVTSGSVGTKFRAIAVPVVSWEQAVQDDFGMTDASGTNQGTTTGQTQIKIVNSSSSLAAGLSGSITIYSASGTLSWGKTNNHAIKVATLTTDTNKAVLYGYEQGTGMFGLRAPARRVGLFLADNDATLLNANGKMLFDSAVCWATGPVAPSALFVVGNATLNSADQAIKNNMTNKGYSVTVKASSAVTAPDANGKNLVLISSTANAANVGSKFTNATVPVLNAGQVLLYDLGMTGNVLGTDMGTTASQAQVKILNNSNPMGGRLSGTQTVCAVADTFTWGRPNPNAYSIASLVSDTSKKTIFGYERGATMVTGTAPARRVGFFYQTGTSSILNDTGYTFFDAAVGWATGTPDPTALFVVGNTTLNKSDSTINARLQNLGYTVTIKSGLGSATSDATGKSIVVVSSTVTSGDVNTKFRDAAVGVVNWEQALLDDFGMTGNVANTDRGTESGQAQLSIADNSNPLAIGYSGTQTVLNSSGTMSWGNPNGNAFKVATVVGNANKSVLFSYEKGASMVGLTAPARRVGFFLEDSTAMLLNTTGFNLFDAAIRWAAELSTVATGSLVGNYNWLHRVNWDGSQNAYNGQANVGGYVRGPSTAYDDEALVKFDLTGVSQASTVTFRFRVNGGNSGGSQTVILYNQSLRSTYNPYTVNYDYFCNSLSDCPSWTTNLGSATVNSGTPGWIDISSSALTQLVQGWISNPSSNQGIVLTGNFAYWGYYVDVNSFQLIIP